MSGKTLESLLSARDEIDQMRELSAQVFAGQPVHDTVRHFRRDGKFLEIEINAVPLRRGGRVQGAYAIYNDVSERAKAEEEAKKHADSLKRWVEELQLRTTQMSLLNEMGDLLQCCASTVEARSVVSRLCRKLLRGQWRDKSRWLWPVCGCGRRFVSNRSAIRSPAFSIAALCRRA